MSLWSIFSKTAKATDKTVSALGAPARGLKKAKDAAVTVGGGTLLAGGGYAAYKAKGAIDNVTDDIKDIVRSPKQTLKEYFGVQSGSFADRSIDFLADNIPLLGTMAGGFVLSRMVSNIPLIGSPLASIIGYANTALMVYGAYKGVCAFAFENSKGVEHKPDDPTNGVSTDLNLPITRNIISAPALPFTPAPALPAPAM